MSNAGKIFQKEKTEHPAALRRGIRVPHYTAYSITMIINDIEFYLVEIPRQADIGFRSLFVRLLSHNGLEGWGEAAVSWRQDEIEPRRKQILPILSGRSIFDLEELIHLEELQPKALRFAVDMACWDMIGRLFKHPVCHFHGGEYRHHIPIIARLSGNSPEEYVRSAQEFSHLGYHWQTLPLSGNPDSDIKCITALLDTFANRIDLRLDASGKYDYSDCLSFLSHLEKKNIAMLIDPLNEENGFYEASALQEQTEIPIALRRGICSAGNVLEITKRGNIRRLVLDPQEFGSILAVKKSAAVAEAAGIRMSFCCKDSAGLLLAAMLQLSASLPAMSLGIECYPHHFEKSLLFAPVEINDGLAHFSYAPGLSAGIDRNKLEQYQIF